MRRNARWLLRPTRAGALCHEESLAKQKISTNERLLMIEADIHRCLVVRQELGQSGWLAGTLGGLPMFGFRNQNPG